MRIVALIILAAIMIAAPSLLGDYQTYLLTLTLIWAILALSMGLVLGFVGQINLGQAAFVAISAYTCSILRQRYGVDFWLAAPVALAAVVIIAALVGLLTLRLKGPFFILVMLAFAEITRLVIANWQDVTNGPLGLKGIMPPEPILGLSFETKRSFYFLALVVLAVCLLALWRLVRSRTGRMLIAVREDELLAEFVGIPVMRSKVIGLCIGAFVAGLGGLLLGPFLSILAPSQFTLFASVDMIVMVVVGGVGTLVGPLIGAVFLVYVPEYLSFTSHFRPAMMGALLIIVTLFAPGGLIGLVGVVRGWLMPTPSKSLDAKGEGDHAG
ncbi:MAG: branched-chain amino acid ABC transporter permease [Mesorhizobium sp.]|nr:branched-chain amino acid ABC transporter permease [Mesorhizobium sp.]MCO5164132.1 branched-chain amino acid ABC transporter permease [Mesorhizobium sp.]